MQTTGGATPLMYACQQCREDEVLEFLRKQPSSVKERDRTFKTPLHYCAENPNTSCAEALLKALPELVNAQDENGYCPLHLAVIAGNKPLIKLLIAKGADVNIHDNEGHSAVHWAIVSSEKEALEMVVRAGANPSTPDIHGGYPLHYAVQMCGFNCEHVRDLEDTIRVVESLLHFGVDVNVKDKDGRQPILWAASAGSADAVVQLISGGACVEAADKDGLTALHCAASRGHTTTLETLISLCGANVDVIDGNGCSALFYAVTLGHADATELLLQLGAEPNRQDRKGRTPAHCGAAKGQLETLRILQKHGGDLWMRNVKGDIPLHEAVGSGRKDLVLWLLSQCPEAINIANNDGRCPLHIASMYNNTEMVKVLLDSRSLVNPVMRTSKGVLMTPLNVALSRGHRSCGKYLQLHGGVPFSKVSQAEPPPRPLAIRISPSEDVAIVSGERGGGSGTLSQGKISKSRSSTDVQDHQESVTVETSDKKKVYRRRKKKKNPANVQTQQSDSDDSVHELRIKTPDNRRKEKSNEESNENGEAESRKALKVDSDAKTDKKEMRKVKVSSGGKTEVFEEATAATATGKVESKPLLRNKSFNETKNISDLSPEDFPPLMQTVDQLDVVIMDGDPAPRSTGIEEQGPDSTFEVAEEEDGISTKAGDGDSAPMEEETAAKDDEEGSSVEEKPGKAPEGSKPNGGSGKDEESGRLPSPKTSEGSSNRKSVKSPKSSSHGGSRKKESKSGKKVTAGSEGSANIEDRKTVEGKSSDATADKDEKSTKSIAVDTNVTEDSKEEEKPATEPEIEVLVEEKTNKAAEGVNKSKSAVDERRGGGAEEAEPGEVATNDSAPKAQEKESSAAVKEEEPKPSETQISDTETMKEKETSDGATRRTVPNAETLEGKDLEENVHRHPAVVLPEPPPEEFVSGKNNSDEADEEPAEATREPNKENLTFTIQQRPEEQGEGEGREEKPKEDEEEDKERKEEGVDKGVEMIDSKLNVEPTENHYGEMKKREVTHEKEEEDSPPPVAPPPVAPPPMASPPVAPPPVAPPPMASPPEAPPPEAPPPVAPPPVAPSPVASPPMASPPKAPPPKAPSPEAPPPEVSPPEIPPSELRGSKAPRVSRLCRRNKDLKEDATQISVTQLVQNTIKKYHMERGIFYQLLELKRYQIRSGRANEQVLVKRLADEYERTRVFLGMKPFSGLYKFREFEKFLYDQLKVLNSRRSFIIPEVKSYDDIDALSGFLKKSRYKIISEAPPLPEMLCTCITQRCHHSACAYTSVPCSAYITDLRRHRHHRPKRESFFPRIDHVPQAKTEIQKHKERAATLELIQGSEKHVITLPQNSPAPGKRYYVTFTIKGAPGPKEEDFANETKDQLKHRHAKSV